MNAVTYQDWKLILLSPWGMVGLVLILAAGLLALGLSAWGYRHLTRPGVRLGLIALRSLAVLAVVALVLEPAVQLRSVTRVPNTVAVVLDTSRSMAISDKQGEPPRLQQALATLQRSQGRLQRWRRDRQVEFYSFGETLRPLPGLQAPLQADEAATLTQKALEELKRRYRGGDLAAVVLLSDGIDNGHFGSGRLSGAALKFLEELQAPVHTVWVGSPELDDLAVTQVFADDFAFVRNVVKVEAELSLYGLKAQTIPVTLEEGGAVVAQQTLRRRPGESRYRVEFKFVPKEVGKYVYTISAPVFAEEALKQNNSRSFLLKVIRDRIRVLQVCGRPSWDERFLRQLLKQDPNVDLISFFILRTPADLALVPTSELSLIPFPTEELFEKELGSFDLILLQNFNFKPYGIGVYLPHLRRYVEQGGGLAMIGGDLSFTSGGYHGTPVGEVLPVELLPPGGERGRLVSTETFAFSPTPTGREHPILQLGRSTWETGKLLTSLPALEGVNLVAGARPGATVLAVHPALRGQDGQPLPVVAVSEVGEGRSMTLATDSLWRWAFTAVGQGATRQSYDRFWRNSIRWLIRDPELKYLRVIIGQDSLRLGDPLRAVIRAYNPDYSPAKGQAVTYRLSPQGSGKEQRGRGTTNDLGELPVELQPEGVGTYRLQANATLGGRANREDALVLVEPAGVEERQPQASPALLKQLSQATGGQYLGRASSLPELALREPRVLHVNWRRDVELWSRWWSLLLVVVLLGAEWWVRRRFGYI